MNNSRGLKNIEITYKKVENAIKDLPNKAAPGQDGILTIIYKKGGEELIMYLVILFKKSAKDSYVPRGMK